MFKPSFWGWVATATLLGACTGEIGGLAGDARSDTGSDLVPDLSASDGWRYIEVSEPAFDTIRFDVMARPEVADIDALVAMGAGEMTDFSDASIKVRFADDGFIDARDGSTCRSDNAVRYRPGVWYGITISANVPARTYDVAVGEEGERPETLITGAAFDSQAAVTDRLTTWAAWSSQSARLDIARYSWVASGSCAPSTCLSLGVVCGEPSDGCDGNLTCGSCGSGQTCNSGVCEDVPPSPEPPPPPSCEPANCMSLGMECGDWGDGCGGDLSCGGCGSGQTCTSGVCVDVMPPSSPPCAPATCTSWGVECGRWSDGCGGDLSCGGCGSGRSCTSGVCVDVQPPPPPPCEPATCVSLGKECGSWNDGCGGTLSCGGCTGSDLCSAAGTCYDPSPPPCIPDCAGKECGGDGCGGSCGTCGGSDSCNNISGLCVSGVGGMPTIFWSDELQTGSCSSDYGFDEWICELNDGGIMLFSSCTEALTEGDNRCNLSRVADPAGGGGWALEQLGDINRSTETRSEAGLYFWSGHSALMSHLNTGAPIFVTQEMYIPSPLPSETGGTPWMSMMDFHSDGTHTNPGIFYNGSGDGTFEPLWNQWNSDPGFSNGAYPLKTDRWFKVEFEWAWKTSGATIRIWIDGNLVLSQTGVRTKGSGDSNPAFYFKLYGTTYNQGTWTPGSAYAMYRRNMTISDGRMP